MVQISKIAEKILSNDLSNYERILLIGGDSKITSPELVEYLHSNRAYQEMIALESVAYCPLCSSPKLVRKGYRKGKQKYICKNCRKSFVQDDKRETIFTECDIPMSDWSELYISVHGRKQGVQCANYKSNIFEES